MDKFEYKVVLYDELTKTSTDGVKELNELGEKGWELLLIKQ
jgi:hypothetical protein